RSAGGALIEALGDEDRLLRFRAARALEAIGDERAVGPLAEVADADDYVRPAAAMALARLAPARAALPLARLAADGFAAEEAVAALTRVLEGAAADITPEDLRAGSVPPGRAHGPRPAESRPQLRRTT